MVIGLLMKEVYGMRLDSAFYNNIIAEFDSCMNKIFGTDIRKTETVCKFEHRGFLDWDMNIFPIIIKL